MPALVPPEFWDAWLDPRVDGASLVLRRLNQPTDDAFEAQPIGALINQLGFDGPEVQQASAEPAADDAMAPRLV